MLLIFCVVLIACMLGVPEVLQRLPASISSASHRRQKFMSDNSLASQLTGTNWTISGHEK